MRLALADARAEVNLGASGLAPAPGRFANDSAIFDADVAALRLAFEATRSDDVRSGFLAFHHGATRAIRRNRIGLLDRIAPERLVDLVEKWAALYRRCYVHLLQLHGDSPTPESPEEAVARDRLGLTNTGLSCLSIASRYAEFWAESATHDDAIRAEWDERMAYVGSFEFAALHALQESEDLLVYDQRGLALPVFDIARIARGVRSGPLWACFAEAGARLVRLSETADRTLARVAGRSANHPGEARIVHAERRPGRADVSAIRFIARTGVIGLGHHDRRTGAVQIDVARRDDAYFIMQSLRAQGEFRRLVFPRALEAPAWAVFPNQNIQPIRADPGSYEAMMLAAIADRESHGRPAEDYRCLDDWYFRGEDHSFRPTRLAFTPAGSGGRAASNP